MQNGVLIGEVIGLIVIVILAGNVQVLYLPIHRDHDDAVTAPSRSLTALSDLDRDLRNIDFLYAESMRGDGGHSPIRFKHCANTHGVDAVFRRDLIHLTRDPFATVHGILDRRPLFMGESQRVITHLDLGSGILRKEGRIGAVLGNHVINVQVGTRVISAILDDDLERTEEDRRVRQILDRLEIIPRFQRPIYICATLQIMSDAVDVDRNDLHGNVLGIVIIIADIHREIINQSEFFARIVIHDLIDHVFARAETHDARPVTRGIGDRRRGERAPFFISHRIGICAPTLGNCGIFLTLQRKVCRFLK